MITRARALFRRLLQRTGMKKTKTDITTSDELSCKEIVELVTNYLEQSLLPETRVQFETHLAACPGCTNYVEQVRTTISMLRHLTEEPVFPETKQELLEVFRSWRKE
ncbi:MAG TPA: zf-HC2 domain-containing protein [Ktedonobacteraceae bacterium]|nr:zf-HC2 domain-containing protein [Ktedonobacteraceae bacterium]